MKKIRTANKLLKRFSLDRKEFSFGVAWGRLVRDLPFLPWEKRRAYYEKCVLRYLDAHYGRLIEQCAGESAPPDGSVPASRYIWTMWWQGEDAMPPIVKACYERLKQVASPAPILITKENYPEWVELSDEVVQKFTSGCISITHLSDIIRCSLLKRYGGLWLDATIYADRIPAEIREAGFYTLHAPGLFPEFVSRGSWSSFLMSNGTPGSLLFTALDSVFTSYWKWHSVLIDYLFVDFAFQTILNHCPEIREMIDELPEDRNFYSLNLTINEAYDPESAGRLLSMSPFQKLTYKKAFHTADDRGRETNYAKLIAGCFGDDVP